MTLMTSRQKPIYRWQKGDLITASVAASICGYNSPKQFQDDSRRAALGYDFTVIWQGARKFFLRTEIDEYLTQLVADVKKQKERRNRDLRAA